MKKEVRSVLKRGHPGPASLPIKDQVTKYTTVKCDNEKNRSLNLKTKFLISRRWTVINGRFYTRGRIIHLDELSFVIRLERRTTKDSSSRCIMRLVPVFILETNNQTNNECLPKFV